jgi:hypothetical protein
VRLPPIVTARLRRLNRFRGVRKSHLMRKHGVDFKSQPLTVLKYAAQSASGWSAACGLTPHVLAESQLGSLGHHSGGRIVCARFDGPTG